MLLQLNRFAAALLLCSGTVLLCSSCDAPAQPAPPPAQKLNVAIFLYPRVGMGDMNGPTDVFTKAGRVTKGQYNVYTVAFKPDLINVGDSGPVIRPDYTVAQMPPPDILVIPGSTVGLIDTMTHDQQVIGFIQAYQNRVKVLLSVCTAAQLLGKAGVLDGRRATTHFLAADELQRQYPKVTVVRNVRYVDEGQLVTASGVTCGMDAALRVVTRYSGESVATQVSRIMQYNFLEQEQWPKP